MVSWRRLGRAPPYFAKLECGFLPNAATRTNLPELGTVVGSPGVKIPLLQELKTRRGAHLDTAPENMV